MPTLGRIAVAVACASCTPLGDLTGGAQDGAPSDGAASDAGGAGDGGTAASDSGADAQTIPDASGVYAAEILSDAPRAYWRLGESVTPTAKDQSGNRHDGTYTGGVTLGAAGAIVGDSDTGASFDGQTGFVTFGDVFGFEGTAPMSLEAWVKPAANSDAHYHTFIAKQLIDANGRQGYGVWLNPAAGLGVDRFLDGNADNLTSAAGVTASQYSHVVVTYDGVTMYLYANGVKAVAPTASARAFIAQSAPFTVGSNSQGGGTLFVGDIDEVAVYDKALAPARVAAHYNVGRGLAP